MKTIPSRILTPIIDTYKDKPIALVGCHAQGIGRECCEFDLMIVGEEDKPKKLSFGDRFFEIFFLEEKRIFEPEGPENSLMLASMIILRDTTFSLSTSYSYNKALITQNSKKAAERWLSLSLNCTAKSQEAIEEQKLGDADFWLSLSGYYFGLALLYLKQKLPSPSHMVEQLKSISERGSDIFTSFATSVSLRDANKQNCYKRLQFINLIVDTFQNNQQLSNLVEDNLDVLNRKAEYLILNKQSVECFSYLGLKCCKYILKLSEKEGQDRFPLSSLYRSNLISKDVISGLFGKRKKEEISEPGELLKKQIHVIAKGL